MNIHSGILIFFILLQLQVLNLNSQSVDHWETVVMAEDIWSYLPGYSEPPSGWREADFDDSSWLNGPGGIGYGDGDDATVINPVTSLYLRIRFTIADISSISIGLLHVDFDDGFVAYINGHEVARANLGTPDTIPAYDEFAILDSYEARLPSGGVPARFFIDKEALAQFMVQGDNVLALQVHNVRETSSDLSSTAYLSVGITEGGITYRNTPSWFTNPFLEESGLPLIVIDTRGLTIPDEPKITALMKVIDNGPGETNNLFQDGTDFDGYVGIEIRGQSSQMFPKKSYSIELRNEEGKDTSSALMGMPAEEDWVLYAPYSDKTMFRNALTFHLGNRMGRWQPKNRFCELYLNGDYCGIYVLTESIKRDSNRLDISKLRPEELSGDDLTGGYIIKADKTYGLTPDEYFQTTPLISYYNSEYYKFTYVYPKYDEIVAEQKAYIKKFLTDAENSLNGESFSDPEKGFRKYFDVMSFIDFQIIQELTNNVDGYRYSTFFYKDKESDGGKLHAGPLWDFDLCYGNEDYTDFNLRTDIWLYPKFTDEYGGRMHWWARMMEDLGYRSVFVNRWRALRNGAFNTDSIMMYIDNKISDLGEAINRNFERWPIIGQYVWPNYFIGDTYQEEVVYLKDWITDRINWMDANVMVAENVSQNQPKSDIVVFPNPVRDMMNLYFYLSSPGDLKIEIFDMLGRRVYHSEINQNNTGYQILTYDLQHLAKGFYILRVMEKNTLMGKKNIIITGR